jgi:hypothetical protein
LAPRAGGAGNGRGRHHCHDHSLTGQGLGAEIHGGLQVVENWNSGNTVIPSGKDSDLTDPDREHDPGRFIFIV